MSTATYERHGGVSLLALLLIAILLIAGVWLYNRHHSETIGDHVGRAIDAAPIVVGKVADEVDLKKAGNAIEDAGDKAGSALSKAGHATSEA
ncbi:MAG: hypothetical protein JF615_11760, partial [Asticcacaulis sp.]|nr:hypothetical protein [Asticcacaulis sp.]